MLTKTSSSLIGILVISVLSMACQPQAEPAQQTQTTQPSQTTETTQPTQTTETTQPSQTTETTQPSQTTQTTQTAQPTQIAEQKLPAETAMDKQQCELGKEVWRSQGPPVRGGITTVAGRNPAEHLDPTKIVARYGDVNQVYNGLVEFRGCFINDFTVKPRLAESWSFSPDGTTLTMKLRDDARWHNKPPVNGRKFTSADVAFSIEHQKREGVLLGAFWRDVNYEVPDGKTVVLKIDEADADFMARLADYRNLMFPKEVYDADGDFKSRAIGTGPFMVQDFRPATITVLERNPDYWDMGVDNKPLPYLDGHKTIIVPDRAAEIAAFLAGQTVYINVLFPSDAEAVLKRWAKTTWLRTPFEAMDTFYINHRHKNAFTEDVRLRRAVSFAIDREELIVSRGGALYASFLPPYLATWAWPQEKIREYGRVDRDESKRLIAEAGFKPNELKITLITVERYSQEAAVVQQHLKAVGIDVTIELSDGVNFSPVLNKHEFEFAWGAYAGPHQPNFWVGDFLDSNSPQNFLGIKDPKLDEFVAAHSKELNLEKRLEVLDALEEYLWETMPYVPTEAYSYNHLVACQLQNWSHSWGGFHQAWRAEAWVDSSKC